MKYLTMVVAAFFWGVGVVLAFVAMRVALGLLGIPWVF